MGKLAKAIAQDLKDARDDLNVQEEEFEEGQFEESVSEALNEIFLDEDEANEENLDQDGDDLYAEEDFDEDEEEEDFDEEDDEDLEPSDYELYNTIFEYPMAMGGFILNCKELLEKYPELRQHRMFLLGGVLEYQPENPVSAITNTFYNYWSFFDAQMGNTAETLATVVKETAMEEAEDDAISLLDVGIESHLSFYVHGGEDEMGLILQEIGTSTIYHVTTPSSYHGEKGEIWLVRVLPPLENPDSCTIVATPYILQAQHKAACEAFVQAAGTIDGEWKWSDVAACLKHGPTPSFWLDYLKETPSAVDQDAGVIVLERPPVFPVE